MNGSKSPNAEIASPDAPAAGDNSPVVTNGRRTHSIEPQLKGSLSPKDLKADDVPPLPTVDDVGLDSIAHENGNAGGDDGESEAETLISSPVKKREIEKQKQQQQQQQNQEKEGHVSVKAEPFENTKAPELPPTEEDSPVPVDVPTPGQDIDDHDGALSRDTEEPGNTRDRNSNGMDADLDDASNSSDSLSEVSSEASSQPGSSSRASSRSRAASERPEVVRNGTESPNPRKRKHRASSVGLPNKRQSTSRKLRQLSSEEHIVGRSTERSLSPRLRSHRRAVSTQSVIADGNADIKVNRKRRTGMQYPVREPRSAKGWEESDASSETTSHGQVEQRRPIRGVGRATSTPGRGPGREHKRYVSKYGFTRMAEACETGDLEGVKYWREKDPDQLELAEFAGNTPLQIASLNGNAEIVEYLINHGVRIDTSNGERDTPLIDAAENGHIETVQALLKAGVDPIRTNKSGQAALDVVHEDTDNAFEIRTALRDAINAWNSDGAKQRREEEEARFGAGPSKGLHFMARTYENLLKLVQDNDRNGVREFLDARVPVDNAIVAAAAKTGDSYLLNMLLAEITEKKKWQKPEKPMLAVLGTSHYEMVKSLTMLEQFNPLYINRQGKAWPEIAKDRSGPNWKQEMELLQQLYDEKNKQPSRRSSSPVTKRDMIKRSNKRKIPDEDSDDDDLPAKPKNGRRLMSRRAINENKRTESVQGADYSDSEDAPGSPDSYPKEMKKPSPPNINPGVKRGPGRPPNRQRSNSAPNQESKSPLNSRRRSSSIRGEGESALPSVEEKDENIHNETDGARDVRTGSAALKEEAKFKIEQAQRLEAKRKEEQEAEAEAKRKEAEAEAEARRAEENRKAEEEQKVEEARRAKEAAEASRKQQERLDEEARQAEEIRRKEAEFAEAKAKLRERVVTSLPPTISHVLRPGNGFNYDNPEGQDYVKRHLLPLQAVTRLVDNGKNGLDGETWDKNAFVLNVQAAPLLGQHGWELLIPYTSPFAVGTLQQKWLSSPCSLEEAASVVQRLQPDQLCPSRPDEDMNAMMAYNNHLACIAERAKSWNRARRQILKNDAIELRWVKLSDVLAEAQKAVGDVGIDIVLDKRMPHSTSTSPASSPSSVNGFEWSASRRKLIYCSVHSGKSLSSINGNDNDASETTQTEATIIHEK